MKALKEKKYTFVTYDYDGNEVERYFYEGYHLDEAKNYAMQIVGNSRDNEARHGRITLA